jgi:hypothetical protein
VSAYYFFSARFFLAGFFLSLKLSYLSAGADSLILFFCNYFFGAQILFAVPASARELTR